MNSYMELKTIFFNNLEEHISYKNRKIYIRINLYLFYSLQQGDLKLLGLSNIRNNKNWLAIISILVIACIVISGFYVYLEFYIKEEPEVEKIPENEIDDRVSPLTNQAVCLEIHRIRKKGIIDVMENSGSKILDRLPIKSIFVLQSLDGLRPGMHLLMIIHGTEDLSMRLGILII